MPPDKPEKYYWDSCVFIDLISGTAERAPVIESLLGEAEKGLREILTSVTTIAEVAYSQEERDTQIIDPRIEQRIDKLWGPGSPVKLVEFHAYVAREARNLLRGAKRQGLGRLRPFDAIHLATARMYGATEFNTYDTSVLGRFAALTGLKVCEPNSDQGVIV